MRRVVFPAAGIAIAAICLLAAHLPPSHVAEGDGATVRIDPASQTVALPGSDFSVDIRVEDVSNLGAFQFDVTFDPAVLKFQSFTEGPFLKSSGRSTFCMPNAVAAGTQRYGCASSGGQTGTDGSGVLVTMTFSTLAQADSSINLEQGGLYNPAADPIAASWQNGSVRVGQPSSSTAAPPPPSLPTTPPGGPGSTSTLVAPPAPPTAPFNAQGTPLAPAAQATAASMASTTPVSGVTPNSGDPTPGLTPRGPVGTGGSASNVAPGSGTGGGIKWGLWGPVIAVGAILLVGLAIFGFKLIVRRRTG